MLFRSVGGVCVGGVCVGGVCVGGVCVGYVWFGHNRRTHIKAPRGSGGVGLLVKSHLFGEYEIETVDKTVEGILGICFTHRYSDYSFVVYSCYLPPEMSPWGRDASSFFAHLSSQIYLFSNLDAIYVVGDFNSRIGFSFLSLIF